MKISVLMPVYNAKEEYLREAIESILIQSYKDFELIILNDSPDNIKMKEIILSYNDSRISFIENQKNLGISESRNRLISLAKGEYLAIMDHDDISLPTRFERQVNFLDKNPSFGVVGTWYKEFPSEKIKKTPIESGAIEEELMYSCPILHPSSMIRKSVIMNNNLRYNEFLTPAEDYALWCDMIGLTKFANIPEILVKYRKHDDNTSKVAASKMHESTKIIWNYTRKKHNNIWNSVIKKSRNKTSISLLNFIPILSVIKKQNNIERIDETIYKLFDILPIIKIKKKYRLRESK